MQKAKLQIMPSRLVRLSCFGMEGRKISRNMYGKWGAKKKIHNKKRKNHIKMAILEPLYSSRTGRKCPCGHQSDEKIRKKTMGKHCLLI